MSDERRLTRCFHPSRLFSSFYSLNLPLYASRLPLLYHDTWSQHLSTEERAMSESAFTNRLSRETSPYLLQHAHNPVDWYPWGPEALERARALDRPIFLSIGYSACHWCHVMERESFEDPAVAAYLNEHFVSIKVDREERPDLDQIYMTAVQLLTKQGGWPMSMFLTPSLKPFYGGTYFPPQDAYGRPSFRRLLESLAEAWKTRRAEVDGSADNITEHVRLAGSLEVTADAFDPQILSRVVPALSRRIRRSARRFRVGAQVSACARTAASVEALAKDRRRDQSADGQPVARPYGARRHLRSARRRLPPL